MPWRRGEGGCPGLEACWVHGQARGEGWVSAPVWRLGQRVSGGAAPLLGPNGKQIPVPRPGNQQAL